MAFRINREEARSWSKGRIREEIADLRREIADQRQSIQEMTEHYDRVGYEHAESGQLPRMEDAIYEWESDIDFLKSLL